MVNAAAPRTVSNSSSAATSGRAMAIVTSLFFMWGFITCLNDILIPHLKAIFALDYAQVMLVNLAFFGSYFVFAIPSGRLIDWIGYQRAMVAGLCVMALGALLFLPAADAPSYPLFLAALIVLAAGVTLLQVAANPYVAVLGPARTASSRLNLTQAFNSLGTFVAPYFGSIFILAAAPVAAVEIAGLSGPALHVYRQQQAASVKLPYVGIAVVLLLLAAAIALSRLPGIESAHEAGAGHAEASIWRQRHLVLGAIGIFLYVGAEVSIGSFLANYLNQPEIGNLTLKTAAKFVALYWGGAMVGRFLGSAMLRKVRAGVLLGSAAIVAMLLVATSMATLGHVAMWSMILVGLFNSIMFPSIFTLGIDGLGSLTSRGSGLLVLAIVGGALIPLAQGAIADSIGIHHAFFLPALCYLYVAYYGFRGSAHGPAPSATVAS